MFFKDSRSDLWSQSKMMTISPLQVRPVLKRAGSVKQIGTAVLDSRVSTYAADRIDGALDVADKYVDKYLPSSPTDQVDCKSIIHSPISCD